MNYTNAFKDDVKHWLTGAQGLSSKNDCKSISVGLNENIFFILFFFHCVKCGK